MVSSTSVSISEVRAVINEHLPGLWPMVDVGLSVCATLLLRDNANPAAVIYTGPPGASKTTTASLFMGHELTYLSDNFTPAAFVSHAANVGKAKLAEVDLLPRIRHRVLITPELAPLFRGKEDELSKQFGILIRVLDGQGLQTDSGTHGQRGYQGDYLFAWLGCTTPFPERIWNLMAQLGSRLFFLLMDSLAEETVEDLVASQDGIQYSERIEEGRRWVHAYLTELFARHGGVRGVHWQPSGDSKIVLDSVAHLAKLLVAVRSGVGNESAKRAFAIFRNLARGHALVHGRTQLSEDDLPVIGQLTASSLPSRLRGVMLCLVNGDSKGVSVETVQKALGVAHSQTARDAMRALAGRGVAKYEEYGQGQAATLFLRPEWMFCQTAWYRALLNGELVSNPGLCVPSPNLAQRHREEERDGGGGYTHPLESDKGAEVSAHA